VVGIEQYPHQVVSVDIWVGEKQLHNLKREYLSIELSDDMGVEADELTIHLPNQYSRPNGEDELQLFINGIAYGKFRVQETTKTQREMMIKAHSINFSGPLKERKNRSWERMKLSEIVAKIAKEHTLESRCDATLFIKHLSQSYESDLNLLMRLSQRYHLNFNIKNGKILMLQGKETNNTLPLFVIQRDEVIDYTIKESIKPLYQSCKAQWHDTKENKTKSIIAGQGTPQLLLQKSFGSEAEALQEATAALKSMTQGSIRGSVVIAGKEVRAGGVLQLVGFSEDDGVYHIKKVSHRLNPSGYRVTIEFQK